MISFGAIKPNFSIINVQSNNAQKARLFAQQPDTFVKSSGVSFCGNPNNETTEAEEKLKAHPVVEKCNIDPKKIPDIFEECKEDPDKYSNGQTILELADFITSEDVKGVLANKSVQENMPYILRSCNKDSLPHKKDMINYINEHPVLLKSSEDLGEYIAAATHDEELLEYMYKSLELVEKIQNLDIGFNDWAFLGEDHNTELADFITSDEVKDVLANESVQKSLPDIFSDCDEDSLPHKKAMINYINEHKGLLEKDIDLGAYIACTDSKCHDKLVSELEKDNPAKNAEEIEKIAGRTFFKITEYRLSKSTEGDA